MFVHAFAALAFAVALHAADAVPLHLLTYSGDQQALEQVDREIRDAAMDPRKLAAIEARLLEALRRGEATFAARQGICHRLGIVLAHAAPNLSADAAKKLGAMLADDRDSDLARLALEPVPGDRVDALFVTALGKTDGRARLGIIESLGRRRAGSAVEPLARLLSNEHAATAVAAAKALGAIGTPGAVMALRAAPTAARDAAAEGILVAAQKLTGGERSAALDELQRDTRLSAAARSAAFRLSLTGEPTGAAARISATLGGSDLPLRQVALEAIADVRAADVVRVLTGKLSSWDAPTQAAVISALGRRGDAAAVAAVSAAASHADAEVRLAAISALGMLPGSRDTALVLARAASAGPTDEAKAARQSLARLNGPDVSSAILSGAERGETALRAVFLEQLALRNMTEGLALLRKARTDPNKSTRIAAVSALGDIAPTADVKFLLDWSIAASEEAEQSRALRSAVNTALRQPVVAERHRAICEAIESAAPEVAQRLMPALPRIGGEQSAACAMGLALRPEANLASAAVSTLGRWSDHTALPSLAAVASKATNPEIRDAAIDAALASFERNRSAWTGKSSEVVATLFASTTDNGKRRDLLNLLNRASDDAALKLAQTQQQDPALAEAAKYTLAVIQANRAGSPKVRASTNPSTAKNVVDGKPSTRWTATANGEEWIEVDFRSSRPFRKITLDQTGRATDFPERYEVFVTNAPDSPGSALAAGKGQRNKTVIELPAGTAGRYLVIKNTQERQEGQWAICELIVD